MGHLYQPYPTPTEAQRIPWKEKREDVGECCEILCPRKMTEITITLGNSQQLWLPAHNQVNQKSSRDVLDDFQAPPLTGKLLVVVAGRGSFFLKIRALMGSPCPSKGLYTHEHMGQH